MDKQEFHHQTLQPKGVRAAYLVGPGEDFDAERVIVNYFRFQKIKPEPALDPGVLDFREHKIHVPHIYGRPDSRLYVSAYEPLIAGVFAFMVPNDDSPVAVAVDHWDSDNEQIRKAITSDIIPRQLFPLGFIPILSTRDEIPEGFLLRQEAVQEV